MFVKCLSYVLMPSIVPTVQRAAVRALRAFVSCSTALLILSMLTDVHYGRIRDDNDLIYLSLLHEYVTTYTVSQINCANLTMAITLSILDRFVKIFSLLQRATNFQQNPFWFAHHTLNVLLRYLEKLKTICTDTFLETLSILQLTSGKSISRHLSV